MYWVQENEFEDRKGNVDSAGKHAIGNDLLSILEDQYCDCPDDYPTHE
jgi:hypothetical protein